MSTIADSLYDVPDWQLLELVRTGHVTSAQILIERHDGRPPVAGIPARMPAAVVWAELLTGRLVLDPAGRAGDVQPLPTEPTHGEELT